MVLSLEGLDGALVMPWTGMGLMVVPDSYIWCEKGPKELRENPCVFGTICCGVVGGLSGHGSTKAMLFHQKPGPIVTLKNSCWNAAKASTFL